MRLQKRTDFALRALLYLMDSGGADSREIAAAHGLSLSHVRKVMQSLVSAGFVRAPRGRGSKSTLTRTADEITVGAVVRALEPSELVECFYDRDTCRLSGGCRIETVLREAEMRFLASLDQVSLSSLSAARSRGLVQIA